MAKRSREALQKAGGKSKDGRTLPPYGIWIVGVDTLHGPDHPLYSDDAVQLARSGDYKPFDAMMRNIRELGVIEPVRVRLQVVAQDDPLWPDSAREAGEVYVAVTGRHRTLLARKVVEQLLHEGLINSLEQWQIDTVLDSTSDTLQLDKVVSENIFRRRVSPIEIGYQVIQMLERGFTMEAMCEKYRYSESQLRNFMALARDGVAELHAAVRAGEVKATEACKIARMPAEEQRKALTAEKIVEQKPKRMGGKVLEVARQRLAEAPWATQREREILNVISGTIDLASASEEVRALFEK